MRQVRIAKLNLRFLLVIAGCALLLECGEPGFRQYVDVSFATLQSIRETREAELTEYFEKLRGLTIAAQSDTLLTHLFETRAGDGAPVSLSSVLEDQIDRHFLERYGEFYDLLWVDTSGFVFYTIRREEDYGTCLFTRAQGTLLANRLREISDPTFVDFEYYLPSREPGAFHVAPVFIETDLRGWLVFQQAINRTNLILTNRQGMGRTGEVYLVNSNGIMLSQSRFTQRSTILKKTVETESIRVAAKAESGNLLITDYRGVRVFSSFSKLNILGAGWYLVAEIDEAEILTTHFSANSDILTARILSRLRPIKSKSIPQPGPSRQTIKVDMGEYGFAPVGQRLITRGVATCTAVAVTFPGQFAVLAHVAPTDESYNSMPRYLFGDDFRRNLVSRLLDRICRYDIYPYEIDSLQFVVVATHDESCWNIIDQLIDQGVFISQIKLLYNPEASYANVIVQTDAMTVDVNWFFEDDAKAFVQSSVSSIDLAWLVRELSS